MDGMSQEQIDALLRGESIGDDASEDSATESEILGASEISPTPDLTPSTNEVVDNDIPDEMGLGLLGEIFNISMGAAAKAVATMIKMKVDISAPTVTVVAKSDLIFKTLEPAVGVKINYTEGITGENIFILSQLDIMKLVDIVVGGTGDIDESKEFDDMHLSAIGEIMNQMMGASSVNVAEFLMTKIDISVPETFKIEGQFPMDVTEADRELIVSTQFKFVVGDIINSEMITTCTLTFAKDLIYKAMKNFGILPEDIAPPQIETTAANVPEPPAAVQPEPVQQPIPPPVEKKPEPEPPPPQQQPVAQQLPPVQEIPQQIPQQQELPPMQPPQQYAPSQYAPPMQGGIDPNMLYQMFAQQNEQMQTLLANIVDKLASNQSQNQMQAQTTTQQTPNISMQPAGFRSFDSPDDNNIQYDNMDLVLDLPLDVAIEIGRTKKTVNEVLEMGEGYIVELDRQSADPIDVLVNGNLVARGNVVVVEENFAVRITEIVSPQDKLKAARGRRENK